MKSIVMDCRRRLFCCALLEDKKLIEILAEKPGSASLVGNIYVGIVRSILPNEFVFIDIGLQKNVFLFINDAREKHLHDEKGRLTLKKGQAIPVQIMRDATHDKAPYVTTNISFTGRYTVLTKRYENQDISVSRKILNNNERERLKAIIKAKLPDEFSAIVRTEAEEGTAEDIEAEMDTLIASFRSFLEKWIYMKPPVRFSAERSPAEKSLTELIGCGVGEIIVNDTQTAKDLEGFIGGYIQGTKPRVRFVDSHNFIREMGIEVQILSALQKKVNLTRGGHIVIERTEACTVIDVNSGGQTGVKNHEESTLALNMDAAKEIAAQVRLRNLSGIIIVDFVDMRLASSRKRVLAEFEAELRKDRIPVTLLPESALGLCCLTRKKAREPLDAIFTEKCGHCGAMGRTPIQF